MANPKSYSCELCKKVFAQKCDYTRHKIKKAPCISLEEMEQIAKAKQSSIDAKSQLVGVFQYCINILRDGGEGIVGEKAFKNLSYLLILKIIEPHIGNEINIDDYEYDFGDIDKDKLLSLVRFTKLSSGNADNIPDLLKHLWDIILSVNPTTKNIFMKDKGFDIRYQATYKKLFNKLNSIDFLQFDYDIMGDAYEDMFQLVMTGKVLGQFFTPPRVKNMMIKLINPQIKPDGTIETCCDPTMGTGGFLKSYLFHILEQSKVKAIEPNWDFITTQGLYGKELEADTYKYAVSNMLISSGHMFEHLGLGDSIREPIDKKFDNVLANPPFGIKGLKYDDFESSLKNEYIPIKSDNAISLFIQAIIYMLKINGKAAVVLPDGQDLFSKTNKTLVAVREYLMKTCDLKEIIYLPSGMFEYTSIKTCVFYFVKKREGTDVLETTIKSSAKTQRTYKFSKTHQTSKVAFYDFNPYEGQGEGVKHLLVEVPIDVIANNSYSLNYAEYIKDEGEEDKYEEGIVVKTLGEVCKIIKGEKKRSKDGKEVGLYPLYYCSILGNLYLDTFDYEGEGIIINKTNGSGKAMVYYGNNKYNVGETTIHFKSNNDETKTKYVYYYLFHNIELIQKYFKGANQKSIVEDDLFKIKIPIPSLEKQQTIVAYLDFIYEKANKTSFTKIEELKQLNEFCLNNQKLFGENVVKELGEVCKVNQGTYIKSDMKIQGDYPVYGGGNVSFYINQYNREDDIIVAKDGVSADCVRYEKKKFFLNHHGWTLICKEQVIKKYMFYYLQSIQPELLSIAKGTAQLGINQENFYKLKIPVPSIEKQKEIVAYCDANINLIKQLENEIEHNKNLAQQFIKGIVKNVLEVEEEEEEEEE